MSNRGKALAGAIAIVISGVLGGCYGASTTAYVGVSGPGPWYGYPYPGRYPGPYGGYGGGFVGVTICCEEEEQEQQGMALPVPEVDPLNPAGQPPAVAGDSRTAQ